MTKQREITEMSPGGKPWGLIQAQTVLYLLPGSAYTHQGLLPEGGGDPANLPRGGSLEGREGLFRKQGSVAEKRL